MSLNDRDRENLNSCRKWGLPIEWEFLSPSVAKNREMN